MSDQRSCKSIFNNVDDIPGQFKIKIPLVQTEYLVNGELCKWEGPLQDVLSPI